MEDKKDTKVAGYLPSPKSDQSNPNNSSEYKEETATEIAVPVTRPSFQEKSKNGSGAGTGTNAGTNSSEYKEETAAEIAAPVPITRPSSQQKSKNGSGAGTNAGTGMGWAALALSILSLFVMPILFGAAGIVLGFVARRRGAEGLGAWAIGIGAISIIVGIFILPFF
jgi:hypothetical protein